MKIVVASDHGGLELKQTILEHLVAQGEIDPEDLGTHGPTSVDYPDFAQAVAERILSGAAERGILICGTGLGQSMAANRYRGIRAALCTDPYMARMAREHNDANVLVLGGRVVGSGLALEILEAFLTARFQGGRHARRIEKLDRSGLAEDSRG